jgi:rhamnogalacturonan endolyase
MKLLRFFFLKACALFLCSTAFADNDAGGGSPGQGAPVTLTLNKETATLDNGIIRSVIHKATGRISSYQFAGAEMVDPRGAIYYSFDGGSNYESPSDCVFSVVNQSADSIEVSCKRTWKPGAGYKRALDIDLHYVLRRGDTGLYAFSTLDHPAAYPAAGFGEWRIVWKTPRDQTTYAFERAYVDDARHWEMPSVLV